MGGMDFGAADAVALAIVPGIGDSDGDHWQSLWERAHPDATRLAPASFDDPEIEDWATALSALVTAPERTVIVCHSLGCRAVAEYVARGGTALAAFVVAPPDPERDAPPAPVLEYLGRSIVPAPFPVTVVASTDDPYGSFASAEAFAAALGAELVSVGARGHINAGSGLGDWPEGRELLAQLVERARS